LLFLTLQELYFYFSYPGPSAFFCEKISCDLKRLGFPIIFSKMLTDYLGCHPRTVNREPPTEGLSSNSVWETLEIVKRNIYILFRNDCVNVEFPNLTWLSNELMMFVVVVVYAWYGPEQSGHVAVARLLGGRVTIKRHNHRYAAGNNYNSKLSNA